MTSITDDDNLRETRMAFVIENIASCYELVSTPVQQEFA
jgi:hypothetical protein